MTDRIQKSLIHLNPVKSLVQHHQTRMTLSSNGPIGASIRVREVPIQQYQLLIPPPEQQAAASPDFASGSSISFMY